MIRSSEILRDSRSPEAACESIGRSVGSRCVSSNAGNGLSRRQVSMLALLSLLAFMPGCTTALKGFNNTLAYNSFTDDVVTGWRDNVWAKRAYNRRVSHLPVGNYEGAFREGFIDGYHDVAQGGSGCQPAMPPRKFWSWKYQSAEGQGKVDAWFQGFTYGAQAAEEEGLGNYRQIQVSGRVEQQLEAHGYGPRPDGCPTCGPIYGEELIPMPENPVPVIQGSSLRPRTPVPAAAMPPMTSPTVHAVQPASFEVERLPPTGSFR